VTGATTWLDEAGGNDEVADDSVFGCGDEHAAIQAAARAVAALSATHSGRFIHSVGRLGGSGRFVEEGDS
jgi:hypothetical protein